MTKSVKPIADVARPNESVPTDTSKPVIVTNRPILRDPMMTDNIPNPDKPAVEAPALAQTASKLNLQPLEATLVTAAKPPELPAEPLAQTVSAPQIDESDTADETLVKPATEQVDAELRAKRDAELQGLVDTKKYFLPIDAVTKRRTKQFVIIGAVISLILALVWLDIALDAGLIKLNGTKAITHFFSN